MAEAPAAPAPKKPSRFFGRLKLFLGLTTFLALVAGGYLVGAHVSGGAWYTFGLPIGGDQGWLRRTVRDFWEDIQFKDFHSAAQYHSPDTQATVDIPYLLERLFAVKPEALDIMDFDVVMVDLDSTGLRARVKSRVKVKSLLDSQTTEKEIMLFFKRESVGAPWYMELETSLRGAEADDAKKH
jgi:hypothetical protein